MVTKVWCCFSLGGHELAPYELNHRPPFTVLRGLGDPSDSEEKRGKKRGKVEKPPRGNCNTRSSCLHPIYDQSDRNSSSFAYEYSEHRVPKRGTIRDQGYLPSVTLSGRKLTKRENGRTMATNFVAPLLFMVTFPRDALNRACTWNL
jgi:hypothetical protein